MNKLGLILPALLLFFACLGGATVPQTQAEEVGYQWLRHVFAEKDGSRFSEVRAVEKDGLAMYYILNIEGGGYVLVAADDACEPILGYSDTGKFVYPIDSPAVRYWLGTYEDQLLLAREKNISSAAKRPLWDDIRAGIFSRWDFTRAVSPLLATTWNQDTYYNQSCPADAAGPNGHAYAGCAATAMGQVMKKWNHPAQGTISHSYVENTYGTLSANFGATTYNWASMPNSLTTYNSAVATLLYHCGVGVDMDYGPYASSANAMTNDAMEVFFGYNPAAQWQWRSTYSDPTWISMMQGDLTAGRPVIYSGYNSGYTTGHTFVMDGFNASNYFHINWGWGGSYDGYFALNSLIPLTGYDYSYFQWAYFNLYPGATISGTVTNFLRHTPVWSLAIPVRSRKRHHRHQRRLQHRGHQRLLRHGDPLPVGLLLHPRQPHLHQRHQQPDRAKLHRQHRRHSARQSLDRQHHQFQRYLQLDRNGHRHGLGRRIRSGGIYVGQWKPVDSSDPEPHHPERVFAQHSLRLVCPLQLWQLHQLLVRAGLVYDHGSAPAAADQPRHDRDHQ